MPMALRPTWLSRHAAMHALRPLVDVAEVSERASLQWCALFAYRASDRVRMLLNLAA